MSRIFIDLPEEERKAILEIADRELRPLRNQIHYLIRSKLQEEEEKEKNNKLKQDTRTAI